MCSNDGTSSNRRGLSDFLWLDSVDSEVTRKGCFCPAVGGSDDEDICAICVRKREFLAWVHCIMFNIIEAAAHPTWTEQNRGLKIFLQPSGSVRLVGEF